jgi:hypothetical protein
MATNLTCALCGYEVKQEGAFFRCQHMECRCETPIDIDEINRQVSFSKFEALDEASDSSTSYAD